MKKLMLILGTRPEIIKLSPLIPLLDKEFNTVIVHTGQHYSWNMDKIFFEELNLRNPDYNVNVGSGTHSFQTGTMMIEIEKIIEKEQPEVLVVQGDTNTSLAGALAAAKMHVPVAHIEAGCRSHNKKMPEEINRIMADHCSTILFSIDKESHQNLINEGIPEDQIHLVGNTAVEACLRNSQFLKSRRCRQISF